MLLEDIKAAFNDRDRISSSDICAALNALEGRPWGDWKGKSLTANQLARLLKPFGIRSDNVRIGSQVPKGYTRQQFEESWTRYLAHARGHTPHEPLHRYNADETGTSATFKALQDTPDVAVQQCEKTPANGHCSVVAVQNPPEAADGKHGQVCGHCGEPEDIYPVAYGDVEAAVHSYCRDAWVAARDDLSIPPYLDRRGEEQP